MLTVITCQDNRCSLFVLGALMGSLNGAVASCAFRAVNSDNSLLVIKSSRQGNAAALQDEHRVGRLC